MSDDKQPRFYMQGTSVVADGNCILQLPGAHPDQLQSLCDVLNDFDARLPMKPAPKAVATPMPPADHDDK